MTAPVLVCGACESTLRHLHGKWICLRSGCPLYGQEQTVLVGFLQSVRGKGGAGRSARSHHLSNGMTLGFLLLKGYPPNRPRQSAGHQ